MKFIKTQPIESELRKYCENYDQEICFNCDFDQYFLINKFLNEFQNCIKQRRLTNWGNEKSRYLFENFYYPYIDEIIDRSIIAAKTNNKKSKATKKSKNGKNSNKKQDNQLTMEERYKNCFRRNLIFTTEKVELANNVNPGRVDWLIKNETSTAIFVKGIEQSVDQDIEKLLFQWHLTIASLVVIVDRRARSNMLRDEEAMSDYLSRLKDKESVSDTFKCLNVESFLHDPNQNRSYKSHIEENCHQLTWSINRNQVEIYFKPGFPEKIDYFYDEDKALEEDQDFDSNDEFHICQWTEDAFKKQLKNICIKVIKDNSEINNDQTFQFTEFRDDERLKRIKTIAASEKKDQIIIETRLFADLGSGKLDLGFDVENGVCIVRIGGKKKNIDIAKDIVIEKLKERIRRFWKKAIPFSIYEELKKKKIGLNGESYIWKSSEYQCKKCNDDKEYEDNEKVILITGSSKSVDKMYKLLKEKAYDGERYISGESPYESWISF